ncbi:MAG: polyphosphate polymerase domain-containing protein [Lachnospiraceae bacterium]|jgi:hypothetical protein|nr:polyphosphate polymerase domain-containing protein [Lachnospiraceae bacterium]GFI01209.1 hypothetical protein IMSAGC005_00031 [Lachnospiraceae bacterium]
MTEKYTEAKYRHEYKYVCDAMQNAVLKTRARAILKRDEHVGFDGFYRIRSLYFDDLEDRCYYENEGGIGERDKYRIRIYNGNISRIALEKKSKVRGMTLKTQNRISEEQCRQLMGGTVPLVSEDMTDCLKQLLTEMRMKNMRPKVIVEYVRYPFVERNGNVRITFDEAISSSNEIGRFLEQALILRPVMERGCGVLEVKWDEYLPDYIKNALQMGNLSWSSFSKYYLCRRYNVYGGIRV